MSNALITNYHLFKKKESDVKCYMSVSGTNQRCKNKIKNIKDKIVQIKQKIDKIGKVYN